MGRTVRSDEAAILALHAGDCRVEMLLCRAGHVQKTQEAVAENVWLLYTAEQVLNAMHPQG